MTPKLSLSDAIRIRVEIKHGATPEAMAERYRVPLATIQRVVSRKTHSVKHITNPLRKKGFKGSRGRGVNEWNN